MSNQTKQSIKAIIKTVKAGKLKPIKIISWLAAPVTFVMVFSHYYNIGLNETESLPNKLFLIKKGVAPQGSDKYIVFKKKGNLRFGDRSFIKLIGGRAGDAIYEQEGRYYINGVYLGTAKPYSQKGEKMELTQAGSIPKGHYFAYSLHKDSYDSKYKEFGLVAGNEIIGVAYPIF